MFKITTGYRLLALFFVLALVIACSKDKAIQPPSTQDTNPVQMVDIAAVIESVAPPEYIAPVGAPSVIDTAWTGGPFPLLDKVFGSSQPFALYANIEEFKLSHEILVGTMRVDDEGNVILGTYVDSHLVDMDDGMSMIHFTATATALTGPTTVPLMAQSVLGTTLDLDYLVTVVVQEMPGAVIKMGMTLSDSVQTIFQWDEGSSNDDEQTRLVYASLDPTDSSFTFRGMGYCQHPVNDQWPNGDRFCWAYNITADANADFSYRSSFFSNGTPGMTFLHCFVGGGNKDTEFALKYRMFSPADTTVCDSTNWMKDQVFGPNYSEGTGLITDYASYLGDELLFTYDEVPQVMIPDPWAEL